MPHPRRLAIAATVTTTALTLAACGGGFEESPDTAPEQQEGPASLQMLIASSGDAETEAVKAAAQAWAQESGNEVEVLVAQDIAQQLAQGFAGGNPPDLFYVDAGRFADYADAGSLYAYADQVEDVDDFYEPLRQTFTFDGTQYCVPKDFSTLALVINDTAWSEAGLGEDDVPTTWDELADVAGTLTSDGQVGLAVGDTRDRIGAFMVQAGGWIVNEDATEATADSPENLEALTYVKGLLEDKVLAYPTQLDAGWGGEAFGTGRAAMTIEGNWIKGAMTNDYPDVEYTVAELPEGPAGKGTLLFTQCWGIAAQSGSQAAAVELVQALTSADQMQTFAEAFGVMPSRQSAEAAYVEAFPEDAAFIAGGEYGQGPVNAPGMDSVLADFDAGLQQLGSTDPKQILTSLQTNASAALGG